MQKDTFYQIRRELHQHPELSGHEARTARFVEDKLQAFHPTKVIRHVGGHGLLVEYFFSEDGPTVLFRADMDAVAVQEPDDIPHHSQTPGVAHKCGHDGHTTILLRFARMLSERPLPKGRVLLLFQPAEENGSGSKAVLDTKVLDYYKIDKAFALHNIPGYPASAVLCKEDSFTCAVVSVSITLTGKTSHAAEPQKGISPIPATLNIVDELLRWNNTDIQSDDYFLSTIVEIHVGEEAYGVSAGNSVIRATLRAKTDKLLHQHAQQLKELVATECKRTPDLQHEMEWLEPFSANENDPQSVGMIKNAALRNNLPYIELQTPFSWGEDFGLFTQQYKGAIFGLGSGENCAPLHSPQYDFPDEVIETGATLFYTIAEANQ
ncbi:MAG TPA: amidohydrolase [Butyricimonas virosa]|jgi:amidohydrolase|uniref:Amidohydrolase n=1 Tax=Butyricimonas virosa TaxID=544645 RepID=A0A413IT64_9BACT|nr:amidohydrolase [Butyricimonas virosa]MDY5532210.1 amidohydrolase [Butyricimonas virosa]QRO48790.1 amidohydrolase [Butyricimonas virosa]RGY20923.1 amidohydrolase [Butyricimonas virosa]RHI24662.1 amidohydrolase [Butyricimonas virosa]UWO46840.1 amidohydrolase [Butyricimonas virosa]